MPSETREPDHDAGQTLFKLSELTRDMDALRVVLIAAIEKHGNLALTKDDLETVVAGERLGFGLRLNVELKSGTLHVRNERYRLPKPKRAKKRRS